MQKVVFYCDRCHNDMKNKGVHNLEVKLRHDALDNDVVYPCGDYCDECYKGIKEAVKDLYPSRP